ncbi:MAG: hypothetical protein O3A57_06245 [Bacteroidetes bacterium]|nr:hypothetical protein [Bacteroidota bacterium]
MSDQKELHSQSSDPSRRKAAGRSVPTSIGWVLWRGGLWFCGLYLGWEGTIRTWRFLLRLRLPTQLTIALVLVLVGSVIILISLVVERIHDAREETGLSDE